MKVLLLLMFAAVGQCALLGSKKCTYGPSYWCSHIEHAKECGALQHCVTTVWKNQLQGLSGLPESCQDVVKILDDVRHSDIASLPEKMAESCTKMTAEKRSVCKDLMVNTQDEVLLLLQSDLPSANIAAALGLCGSSPDPASHSEVESKQETRDYCTDCLNFFEDLQEIVNNTEEGIAEKLKEKICTKLSFLEKLCNQTVDAYSEFIFSIIVQQLNPQDMCYLLQLCTNETGAEFMTSLQFFSARTKLQTLECDMCKNMTKQIQNALRNPDMQKEILTVVESKICPMMPPLLVPECKSAVSEYGYIIFQVLITQMDPVIICQKFGFCNATETEKFTMVPMDEGSAAIRLQSPEPREKAMPQCILCEFVMKELGSMINASATEKEIEAALDKVCSLMPKTIAADCTGFVDKYGKQIIEYLMEMTPDAVCTALGLCVGKQPVLEYSPVPEHVKAGEMCTVCESVVAYVKSYIDDPDNVKTIEELLDEVCVLLPKTDEAMCEDIINAYTPDLITLLDQYDDPVKVCTELTLCPPVKVGGNMGGQSAQPLLFVPMAELLPAVPHVECSQGPKVWCASVENAQRCKAVKYCVEYHDLKMEA